MEENTVKMFTENQAKMVLDKVEYFIAKCEKAGYTDEQWFLDFEDKLNKLSVRDHH